MDRFAQYALKHPVRTALWGMFAGAWVMLVGTDPRMASKLILWSSGFPMMLGLLSAIMARDSGEPKIKAFAEIGILAGLPGFVLGHLLYLPFSGPLCILLGCLLSVASMVSLAIALVKRTGDRSPADPSPPARSRHQSGVNQDA